jgi:molybdopterin/thiamine biosynthesis adenylyltransferase
MDRDFFSRQLKAIGKSGQEKLGKSTVSVVGAGGLGSHVASILVRTGFGTVRIIDRDVVEKSNLHRVSLYTSKSIGMPKAVAARSALELANPGCTIEALKETISKGNVKILKGSDLVVDCTDNMEARFVINDFCAKNRIPWIYAAVAGDEGFSATFAAGGKPCLRCLYPDVRSAEMLKPRNSQILPPVVMVIASWEAMEAVKIASGFGKPSFGKLLRTRLKEPSFEFIMIKPRAGCPVCGGNNG